MCSDTNEMNINKPHTASSSRQLQLMKRQLCNYVVSGMRVYVDKHHNAPITYYQHRNVDCQTADSQQLAHTIWSQRHDAYYSSGNKWDFIHAAYALQYARHCDQ